MNREACERELAQMDRERERLNRRDPEVEALEAEKRRLLQRYGPHRSTLVEMRADWPERDPVAAAIARRQLRAEMAGHAERLVGGLPRSRCWPGY